VFREVCAILDCFFKARALPSHQVSIEIVIGPLDGYFGSPFIG